MSLLQAGFGSSSDDAHEITDSLRFRSSASAYLSRTPTTAGNRRTWTLSWWAKRGLLGSTGFTVFSAGTSASDTGELVIKYDNNYPDSLAIQTGSTNIRFTNALYRDPSAWHHVVVAFDTTQGTASNRTKVYVNGAQITSFNISNDLTQNTDTSVNNTVTQEIGVFARLNSQYLDGYLTEVQMIDGQQLDADDFGEYDANGTWKAKNYTGTYGTNGFYLPMKPTTQAELQNTVLYAGNTNEQSINGVGYAPDLVWIKNRTGANPHYLYDTVRGTDRSLTSNSTSAEAVGAQQLTSFDTDGFTVPYDVSGYNNYAGRSYVAWSWDAGDNQPSTGHSSVLYVGQGVAQSIKGFGFSPDLIMFRNRAAASPLLIDSVRGPFQELQPNSTGAETSNSGTRIASIDADGFSFASTSAGGLNASGNNYVAWGWDAGDGDPVTNTTGSINSTVKANPDKGFSVVSYEGTNGASDTIGHGLSSAPEMVIVKDRDSSNFWSVYHAGTDATAPEDYLMRLNTTDAKLNGSVYWNDTAPTSSVFTVGTSSSVNAASSYIAYCFHSVAGFSKFDSYTGTGSVGKAVTTGFRPGFLLIKCTNVASDWMLFDSTRNSFNPANKYIQPNNALVEASGIGDGIEFTNTGFEVESTNSTVNASGNSYIYMAFKGSYSDYVSPLNDTGSIDSRVKANTSKGFSIVSYTGDGSASSTVGHGLGSSASMIIVKDREVANNWRVWHEDLSANNWLYLNLTNAEASAATDGGIRNVDANTFGFINGTTAGVEAVNTNGRGYMAYVFSEVSGVSNFGAYTGTGAAGNSVTGLGFQPAWLMIKETTSTGSWAIVDTTRSSNYDAQGEYLWANLSSATGGASAPLTFDSDGFTINSSDSDTNASGQTYIYMAFADTRDAQFNFDASGNKNNFDANNINSNAESESTYDLMKDTPSLVDENAGNFATLSPINSGKYSVASTSEANLKWTDSSGGSWVNGTIAVSSGKWYWETNNFSGTGIFIGVADATKSITSYIAYYSGAPTSLYYLSTGQKTISGSSSAFGAATTTSDLLGFALDADADTLAVYKNNVLLGTMTSLGYEKYSPIWTFAGPHSLNANFGQRPFKYTPPTGFLKLNTFNLPDSTIEKGSDYFNPVLYTGDSTSNRNIPTGFAGGWTWIKNRNLANSHTLSDVVRGDGKTLFTNATNAEVDYGANGIDLVSDGFDVTHSATNNLFNVSGRTYVAWNWKANGSGSTNTAGDVNSTVSVDTTAGFSIATATTVSSYGSFPFTIGHGLGTAPAMVIYKSRTSAGQNWWVWHKDLPNAATGRGILLNSTGAEVNGGYFASNPATATTMGINAAALINDSVVMYSFAEVEGYSAFGSYTGNGSADGPFVYTGFRPAFVITKRTNSSSAWPIHDDKRSPYNVTEATLYANALDAEVNPSTEDVDFLSNGFKMRGTTIARNSSGSTYIYMAFAENPFKNSNAR